jgi:hypothetical protein
VGWPDADGVATRRANYTTPAIPTTEQALARISRANARPIQLFSLRFSTLLFSKVVLGYRSSTRRKPNSHAINPANLGLMAHVPKSTPSNFRYMRGITFSRTPYMVEEQHRVLLRYPGCRAF